MAGKPDFRSTHFHCLCKNRYLFQLRIILKDYLGFLRTVFQIIGQILLDRLLRAHKQNPDELTVLDRLAIVGTSGMGALTYHPEKNFPEEQSSADLDKLAEECQKILNTEYSDKLDELYLLGGTSGGARPKIMTTIDNEEWIIKFQRMWTEKMQEKWNMTIPAVPRPAEL